MNEGLIICSACYNKMEELALIIEQRRRSIARMGQVQVKFQLIEEERKRSQRENWILRVLKSLKVLSADQKRAILATTLRLMAYHRPPLPPPDHGLEGNFLELMINLFVDFFNGVETADVAHLKAIIRPNNNYIVVDLLRTLVEMGRREFKLALLDHYKPLPPPLPPTPNTIRGTASEKKLSIRSWVRLPPLRQEGRGGLQDQEGGMGMRAMGSGEGELTIEKKLHYALMQKYGRAVQGCNCQSLQVRSNQLYLDLLYANQRNSLRIQKYLDGCFGPRRHINYDASGLYTQEEMRRLLEQQQERTSARLSEVGDLRGDCSSQQLREYFKMQVELQVAATGIRGFARHTRLQSWFPLALLKSGDKLHPLQLVVDYNGTLLPLEEFQQRSGKRIRNYMREQLMQARGEDYDPAILQHPEYIRFPRKDLISYQQAKVVDLLNQEGVVRREKESLLPSLTDGDLRRKVKSQSKIGSRSVVMGGMMEREVEKRLNYSSMLKEGKGRIQSVIDRLLRPKDYH